VGCFGRADVNFSYLPHGCFLAGVLSQQQYQPSQCTLWSSLDAETGGAAFFAIYLLKSGVPVPGVFVSLALILLGRFVIRPVVIGFAIRWDLRAMVIAGTVLSALHYPLLAEVHGVGVALVGLIAMSALGGTVYWTTYHAYFAALGEDNLRGQQIGVREAGAALVGIASPLLTGWMLVVFGPRVAFGATSLTAALAALPLLWTPKVKVGRQVPGAFRAAVPGMLLFAADGWVAAGYVFVSQIAPFLSLGESLLAYGGALAFAALAGAIGSLTLGRHIDAGRGKQAVWYAFGAFSLIVVLRAVATGRPAVAVLVNALGAFGECLYISPAHSINDQKLLAIMTKRVGLPCECNGSSESSARQADLDSSCFEKFRDKRCSIYYKSRTCGITCAVIGEPQTPNIGLCVRYYNRQSSGIPKYPR
jgi:DHA1 family inner membrane transport protein